MNKFILIDHSIQKYGGHNLEYAVHVLRAAERRGYKPVLATNQVLEIKNDDSNLDGIDIHPLYVFDFWGTVGLPRKKKPLVRRIKARYTKWRTKWKIKFAYSDTGLFMSMQHRYSEYLSRMPYGNSKVAFKLVLLAPLIYAMIILRGSKQTIMKLINIVSSTFIGTFFRFGQKLLLSFAPVTRAVLSPFFFVNRHKRNIYSRLRKSKRIKSFAESTHKLLKKTNPREGDIVFIPTLSELDMIGLMRELQSNTTTQLASWNLLFRRNIFVGREPNYFSQMDSIQTLRKMFLHFHNHIDEHKVHFYTDTDKLTDQYNFLKVMKFATVAIPINEEFGNSNLDYKPNDPVNLVYIGDARREKGYQYLPELARSLYTYLESGKAKFTIQSNFSFTEFSQQADVVIARSQLERFGKGVQVIKDALSTEEYKDLVLQSDIGIILYDRDNYYARSSGALVEYLCAGIPVVVPSGSWMADQICDSIYKHQLDLKNQLIQVASWRAEDMDYYSSTQTISHNNFDRKVQFGGHEEAIWFDLPSIPDCNYLLVSFKYHINVPFGTYITIQFEVDDEKQSVTVGRTLSGIPTTALFSLPYNKLKSAVILHNRFSAQTISIEDLEFTFLQQRVNHNEGIAFGAVGAIVDNSTEAASCLAEMVDHYEHYRHTAQQFSEAWNAKHSANTLLDQLVSGK